MANRWKGNLVANAATSSGTAYTGKADGAWGLNSQLQQKQSGLWSRGIGAPNQPTSVTASIGDASSNITFTAPTETGGNGASLSSYTVKSYPDSITATGSSSPIAITGLTNGVTYNFTVSATNSYGFVGPESSFSNSVTPVGITSVVAIGTNLNNTFSVYKYGSGFSTKYANPSSSLAANGCSFAPNKNYLATAGSNTPFIAAYNWSNVSGFGSRFANAGTIPAGQLTSIDFNSTSNAVVVGGYNTPFVEGYAFSSSGFGTKYADPATLPTATGKALEFNYNSTNLLLAQESGTSRATVYAWSSGFGTKYASPSAYAGGPASCTWSSNGSYVSLGYTSGSIDVWSWSSGFGTRYTPASPSTTAITGVTFNTATTVLLASAETTLHAYAWSSSGFGTKYADPPSVPSAFGTTTAVSFSANESDVICTIDSSPYAASYQWSNAAGFGTRNSNPATSVGASAYCLDVIPI